MQKSVIEKKKKLYLISDFICMQFWVYILQFWLYNSQLKY